MDAAAGQCAASGDAKLEQRCARKQQSPQDRVITQKRKLRDSGVDEELPRAASRPRRAAADEKMLDRGWPEPVRSKWKTL